MAAVPSTINSKLSKFQNCTFKTWCYTLIQLPINNSQVHASCFTSNTLSEHLVSKNLKFCCLFFIKKLIGLLLVFLFMNKVSSILWKSPWLWFKAKKLEYKQIHYKTHVIRAYRLGFKWNITYSECCVANENLKNIWHFLFSVAYIEVFRI